MFYRKVSTLLSIFIFRVVGKAMKIHKQQSELSELSVSGRAASVTRQSLRQRRVRNRTRTNDDDDTTEEVFAEHHDQCPTPPSNISHQLSRKFELEPCRYFEEKVFSALLDKLINRYQERIP